MHHRQTVLGVTVAPVTVIGDSKDPMGLWLSSCVDFIRGRVADRPDGKLEMALSCPFDLTIRDFVEFCDDFGARIWLSGHEMGSLL